MNDSILKRLKQEHATMFLLWPNLLVFTERYCHYVSPLMPATNGEPLIEYAIKFAVQSYKKEPSEKLKAKAYIETLLDVTAKSISCITIQGVKKSQVETWEPFIEPITYWMDRNGFKTIRTIPIETSKEREKLARSSLMTHLLPARDVIKYGL